MKVAIETGHCDQCGRKLYTRRGVHFIGGSAPCPMCQRARAVKRREGQSPPVLAVAHARPKPVPPVAAAA